MLLRIRSALTLPGTIGTSLHPLLFLATIGIFKNAAKICFTQEITRRVVAVQCSQQGRLS